MAKPYFAFRVSGDKELAEAFEQLPKAVGNQVLRTAARKALKPVEDVAKSMVETDEGELRDSITISTRLSNRQRRMFGRRGDVVVHAGPSHPKGAHGVLVEFGSGPRYQKSTGRYVGVMPAKPFMRPAWDQNRHRVLEIMRTEIWDVLLKAVRRLRKRAENGKLSASSTRFFRDD